ncbi:hypothetical protein WJX72_002381 [[Myrmecia] bisecta]|uniref:Uncharacterized protein n=1 Tax=[Myrmecia] bisecta TaxID=41462 RepID=A0AAW1QPF7_9CHLO
MASLLSTPKSYLSGSNRRGSVMGSPAGSLYAVTDLSSCYSPSAASLASEPPVRALEAGTLVCFYTSQGELVTVKQQGRGYELHAVVESGRASEAGSMDYFPTASCFLVVTKGSAVGFRSLGAEGRSLQAVKDASLGHRVNNHNFGKWEEWTLTESGYVNLQWNKRLGLDVKEVRIVAVDDMRTLEKQLVHTSRAKHAQVRTLEHKLSDSERRLHELVSASRRQCSSSAQEVAELRRRLEDVQTARVKAEAEAARRAAALTQMELRLSDVASEQEGAEQALESAGRRIEELEAELCSVRDRSRAQLEEQEQRLAQLERSYARERDLNKRDEKRVADVDREVHKVLLQKDAALSRMQEQAAVKDMEIDALMEERDRLDAALQSISRHLNTAAVKSPPTLRGSIDQLALRSLRKALGEADLNANSMPPRSWQGEERHKPTSVPDTENQRPHAQDAAGGCRLPRGSLVSGDLGCKPSPLCALLNVDMGGGCAAMDTPRIDLHMPCAEGPPRGNTSGQHPTGCSDEVKQGWDDDESTLAGCMEEAPHAKGRGNVQDDTRATANGAMPGAGSTASSTSPSRSLHVRWLPASPSESGSLVGEDSFFRHKRLQERKPSSFLTRKPLNEMD